MWVCQWGHYTGELVKAWVVDDHRDNDDSREEHADGQRERHRKGERERERKKKEKEIEKQTKWHNEKIRRGQ